MSGEQDMRKMGGLWRTIPITYALMWIGSLALAGIGIDGLFGFAGFYSKDMILEAAVASQTRVGTFSYVLGLCAAFMTAFYSWRLIIMTFHGKSRADHHVQEHAHESPWIMLAPLMPLALGAIFAGWYAVGWFGGEGRDSFWKNAIFVLKGHNSIGAIENIPEYEKWLPLGVALPGMICAYIFYVLKPEWPGKLARMLGGMYKLVYHKYYFDELYDFLFVRPAQCLGKVLWQTGDEAIIDGYGPDGFAALTMRIAKRVGALETGYVYHYAFAMVIGVAGFITWFWFKG